MSAALVPEGLAGRTVTVIGSQRLYRVVDEWRGYLRLEDVSSSTTHCESPGRVLDDQTGRWWAELVEQWHRFADYNAARADLLEQYAAGATIASES